MYAASPLIDSAWVESPERVRIRWKGDPWFVIVDLRPPRGHRSPPIENVKSRAQEIAYCLELGRLVVFARGGVQISGGGPPWEDLLAEVKQAQTDSAGKGEYHILPKEAVADLAHPLPVDSVRIRH